MKNTISKLAPYRQPANLRSVNSLVMDNQPGNPMQITAEAKARSGHFAVRWMAAHVGDILGLLILLYLGVLAFSRLNISWDTLVYHLPFAAFRTGIISPHRFVLPVDLRARFHGFPPIPDLVQGALWGATGRLSAANLISPLAILALAVYARFAFGLQLVWTIAIFLAVPILQSAIDAGYTDLWTNAFFSLFLLASARSFILRNPHALLHAGIAAVSLGIAVNSKEQYYVIGGVATVILMLTWLALGVVRARASGLQLRPPAPIILFLLLSPFVFYTPIKNLFVYGNPVYPETVTLLSYRLPGLEKPRWFGPLALADTPQPARFALSELGLNAVNRPGAYTIDQGERPRGSPGFRMGGSLGVLFVTMLGYLAVCLLQLPGSPEKRALILSAAALMTLVAFFPGSNELRYFSFIEITGILTVLIVSARHAPRNPYLRSCFDTFRILLCGAAIYTSFITGFHHLRFEHSTYHAIMHRRHVHAAISSSLKSSNIVCYIYNNPFALLYTYHFNKTSVDHTYRTVEVRHQSQCPTDAAVIR